MASLVPFSPFRGDWAKIIVVPVLAVVAGMLAWSGEPQLLPVAMLYPALWSMAPNRIGAALVSAGYFLAASRGLPQGVANFYGSGFWAGIVLWFGAALGFVLVHAVLWTARPGMGKVLSYGLASVLMAVPPFGIVGWAHPITAAGTVFPGWGWWGLLAAAIGLLATTTRSWPVVTAILAGFWIWSSVSWTSLHPSDGWVGIDTQFGGSRDTFAGYPQHLETIAAVRAAVSDGGAVVVLPEGAVGIWTSTAERLWRDGLVGLDVVVEAGAIIVNERGYDNVMLGIDRDGAEVLYRQRMPVPVSMWQPWQELSGQHGGVQAYLFANPAVSLAGHRVAPLICYEQLLVWPILQSLVNRPDVIVATGNGWWTTGTSIIAIQRASAIAWARLFNLPLVMAFNT